MSDGSIIIDTKIDNSGAEKGIGNLSGKLGSLAKGALAGITAATVAVGGLIKASVGQYSQFEQLTGGVETLFKNSSNIVMDYANNAYKTAGMSANEYMATITGFSASLLQGLGGDTKKAAEIGNKAVTDMSDNANKMGSSMESIQNAYQGFAKQNYTMLDNLKLGYGGTKEEMQRLLADAEKLTGIKYSISNFSDIIEAIHAIQNQMGITGTTAKEASETIEGSLNMTKSAWTNLLTGMADDNANFDLLVDNLVESAGSLGKNLLPRIEIALNGLGDLITKLLPPIAEKIPELIMLLLPKMIEAGTNVVTSLITGIQNSLPTIANGAVEIINSLVTALLNMLPQLPTIGMQAIAYLIDGIGMQLPTLIPTALECILSLIKALMDNLPLVLNAGMDLIYGLVTGIINAIPVLVANLPLVVQSILDFITSSLPNILNAGLDILLTLIDGIVACIPQLVAMLPQIINAIVDFILNNLPTIVDMGLKILVALIDGIIAAIPQLISMLPQVINAIISTLIANLPQIIRAGIEIIFALINGLIRAIPDIVGAIPQIVSAIWDAFTSINWWDLGSNIIKGIGSGIAGAVRGLVGTAIEACKSLKDSVKSFFGIASPSKLMRDLVGVNLMRGIGVGVEMETPDLQDQIDNNLGELYSGLRMAVDAETAKTTASVVAQNNYVFNNSNSGNTNGINDGSTFILKNEMDGQSLGETVYRVVDGKLALAGKRVR
ncbi:hypothetical protein HF846_07615 [Clostridium cadaveris]|uniref:phage tail protein n=1 Tax=Clostridium cadaveris TaxID=1529 RepID=UPI0014592D4D|nr:hypothetical protein [Clostridium cadaveris]NME64473.1 hypothetical protein [Clostridium cadaveris]